MNWGNKIVLVFVGFAALIGVLVFQCMQQNFELVSKEYYKDEISYQKQIDGSSNASKISPVSVTQTGEYIVIQMPGEVSGEMISGEAWFYCANNAANDRKIAVKPGKDGVLVVDKKLLAHANYQLKMQWQANHQQYYNEQTISIP